MCTFWYRYTYVHIKALIFLEIFLISQLANPQMGRNGLNL